MPRRATLTRLGDQWEGVKGVAAVIAGVALAVLAVWGLVGAAIGMLTLIQLWSEVSR